MDIINSIIERFEKLLTHNKSNLYVLFITTKGFPRKGCYVSISYFVDMFLSRKVFLWIYDRFLIGIFREMLKIYFT